METKKRQKQLFGILYACLAASVVAELLVPLLSPPLSHEQAHAAFVWQEIPGFSAIYGFVGCILIIVVSKALGHRWLQKEVNYYD
ncbi:MAG: hypothetical protein ACXQT6_05345 [Candidatus Methanospirareceae archaeon]|nr:hypothetical protein [Methanophagales archaeon]HDN68462.1 hypothetical protein [Methanomicrobia archaeon]